MKILLTVHQFFPEHTTGTEVLTLSVAIALRNQGHDVCVLTGAPSNGPVKDENRLDRYEYDGFQVYRAVHPEPGGGRVTSVVGLRYNDPLVNQYFKKIIAEFQPDMIHFFHLDRLGAGLIDVAIAAGIPAFFIPTDFWPVCPTGQLLLPNEQMCRGPSAGAGNCVKHLLALKGGAKAARLSRLVPDILWDPLTALVQSRHREVAATYARAQFILERINKLNGILAPNTLMQDILLENGVRPDLITLAGFGINQTPASIGKVRIADDPLRVGFIGTLARHKGCHVLVDAFAGLPEGQATLKIYGNIEQFPDYMESLKDQADSNPDILFCGTFPNAEIMPVLNYLDVLVVPSIWFENTPLIVYSALQAQCPIIASDLPGLNDTVLDGVNGLTFEAKNSQRLRAILLRLLNEPDLLEHLRQNISPPKTIDQYINDLMAMWQPHVGT